MTVVSNGSHNQASQHSCSAQELKAFARNISFKQIKHRLRPLLPLLSVARASALFLNAVLYMHWASEIVLFYISPKLLAIFPCSV